MNRRYSIWIEYIYSSVAILVLDTLRHDTVERIHTVLVVTMVGMFITWSAVSGVPGNGGSFMNTGRLSGCNYTSISSQSSSS